MRRTLSVWRWQLIFAGSIVSVAVFVVALKPEIFAVPLFVTGLLLIVVATVAVIALPWSRIPNGWIALIPLLDIVAIGLTTSSSDIRLGFLWVFPVTWIATYYSSWVIALAVAMISICLIVFSGSAGFGSSSDITMRVLITVLTMGFLGTTIRMGSTRSRAAKRLLRRQSEQVNRTAARAAAHERRVTQIIDALDTALVAVSEDGAILKMNDAYRELYGRDEYGAQLPSPAVEYDDRRGDPLPPEQTSLARAAHGETLSGEMFWLYDTEGRWRALRVSSQVLEGAGEGSRLTLLIIDDITAQLESSEEREKVAAIVSHELRNPLTAILGHVELLLEGHDLPPRAREQLEVVLSASERMEALVTSVLEDSRPAPELFEPVDLRQLVEASMALFAPTAAAKELSLSIKGPETLLVRGDAFRLRQAIDNIVSNAVKYTRAGGSVSVTLGVAADGSAETIVADTGIGISPEDLPQMFRPYFRAAAAVNSATAGTGLGMSIVHDIITGHCGEIEVTSEVGAGTSVRVLLPRERVRVSVPVPETDPDRVFEETP